MNSIRNSVPTTAAGGGIDAVGMLLAIACAIHCTAGPLLSAVFAGAGTGFGVNPLLEWGFVGASLIVGVWSRARRYGCHRTLQPLLLFAIGLTLLAVGRIAEDRVESLALWCIVPGAFAVAASHATNVRCCHRARVCGS